MKFKELDIKGVYLITPEPFKDKRGIFRRHFCSKEFKRKKLESKIRQSNISENKYLGTLRGFHYQTYPYQEAKTLSCISGRFFDVVIDLRKKSKTYKKWISVILSSENRQMLHVPKGCANSFMTLKNNTIIHYYCSQYYHPNYEKGIRYNDSAFKIKWPMKPKIISKKDKNFKNYTD
jgi:dTDP-4-dehydrorhamnose 3,5-epimerase